MTCLRIFSPTIVIVIILISSHIQLIQALECPPKCTCERDESTIKLANVNETIKVICDKLDLSEMPKESSINQRVTRLSLQENKFKNVSGINFWPNLIRLDLTMNNIEQLEAADFKDNPKLQIINLGYNEIKEISIDAFKGLQNLQTLNLEHNYLRKLKSSVFNDLINLQSLDLSQNDLRSLPDDLFETNRNLSKLNLSNNELHTLPDTLFHENLNLLILDISKNKFNKVPSETLHGAENLKELDISGNLMRKLDFRSFFQLSNLETLRINGAKYLKTIDEFTFSDLCKLSHLEITRNPFLSELSHNAFFNIAYNTSCFSLKHVDLHGNQLSSLMIHTLPACKIDTLDLRDNQWRCDCLFRWVKSCKKDDKIFQQTT